MFPFDDVIMIDSTTVTTLDTHNSFVSKEHNLPLNVCENNQTIQLGMDMLMYGHTSTYPSLIELSGCFRKHLGGDGESSHLHSIS